MKIPVLAQRFIGRTGCASLRCRLSRACEPSPSASSTEKATDGVVICLPMVSGIITLSSSVRSVWRIMVPNESMTTTTLAAFNRGARRFASDKRRAFTVGASIRSSTFLSKSSSKWIFFSFSKKENHAFCCRHSSGTSVIRKNARNSASSSVDVSHCQ